MQEYVENVLQLPMNRRDGIGKLASALKYRIQVQTHQSWYSQLNKSAAPWGTLGQRHQ